MEVWPLRSIPAACAYPGCSAITRERYCPEHARERNRRKQENRRSDDRMYSQQWWRRLRQMVLRREPWCRMCRAEGRFTPATEVDHIVPVSKGGTNEMDNLQALCKSCHSKKTARDTGWSRRGDAPRG